jgi:hypothetical protein
VPQLEGHRQESAVESRGKTRKSSIDARERCTELDGFLDMALHLTRGGSLSSARKQTLLLQDKKERKKEVRVTGLKCA